MRDLSDEVFSYNLKTVKERSLNPLSGTEQKSLEAFLPCILRGGRYVAQNKG